MKRLVYFLSVLLGCIVSAVVFHRHINLSALSILPAFLIVLMLFQAYYFRNEQTEKSFGGALGSNYSYEEEQTLSQFIATSLWICAPLQLPFVLFFGNGIKALSIFIYLIGFGSGALVYRCKNRNALHARVRAEQKELEDQKKNESIGKWK
ncbi:MAG: hypothetical protein IJD75_05360 [Clostridia bacterium]|nr:hypothetical protein [Clostridia bacterium]